jgi:hypothetical protein
MPAWSGLFNGVYGQNHALQFDRNSNERLLRMALRGRGQQAIMKELILTLTAGNVGDVAASSFTQVCDPNFGPSNIMKNYGVVGVETNVEINRATTSADVAEITAVIEAGPNIVLVKDIGGNSIKGDPRWPN